MRSPLLSGSAAQCWRSPPPLLHSFEYVVWIATTDSRECGSHKEPAGRSAGAAGRTLPTRAEFMPESGATS
jgi:hypothetical protein